MINQGLVRELILKGQISKIKEIMEQNTSLGMRTFDQSLLKLFVDGFIAEETAVTNSDQPSDMKIKIRQAQLSNKNGDHEEGLSELDTSLISFGD
jgi:twitching motility protein PilU